MRLDDSPPTCQTVRMPPVTKLDYALDACSRGFRVFPADGKRPRIRDWPNNASAKASVAERHWARWPDADIAIALDPDIYVFDADTPAAMHVLLCELDLPRTLAVDTARGQHRYFRVPHELARMPGGGEGLRALEGKGAPGPVHWAGSVHASGHVYRIAVDAPIADMPADLVFRIGPKRASRNNGEATDAERALYARRYDLRCRSDNPALVVARRDGATDLRLVLRALRCELPDMLSGWAARLFRAGAYLGPCVAAGALGLDEVIEELTALFHQLDTDKSDPGHALRSIERGVAVGAREALR